MKNLRYFAQKYIDWVIKLGRLKFSLLGITLLAILAVLTQILLSIFIIGEIHWGDLARSITFGLISAPFVIYFFTLLVEKLELSRINLARSVKELQQEIQERILAERRLAQTNRDKTALMATISHELRTPLNGIIGLSRILLDGNLSEQQRDYLKTISVSAISLGHIFNDIIDLEKIDGRRIELHKQETDFYAFLNDIENIGRLMAEQKHLQFTLKCGENLPHFLMLDNTRLSQVLWNLLSNATKFTEKGLIGIDVQRAGENEYLFAVSDSGQGIPHGELDKIFTMYYQVEHNKCKPAGSGIGLAIAKQIATLMDGDLTVKSKLGQGSTFLLRIRAEESGSPLSKQIVPSIADLRVLLVEDIELNVIVAKSVLEKQGYQVDVAMSGRQAIEKFERNIYDLVLLDIQLPDMSGFQVAQHLRQKYEEGIYDFLPPLIALTANIMHSKAEYQQQGMDDVLRKPLSVKALNRCLSDYFGEADNSVFVVPVNKEPGQSSVDFEADFVMLNDLIAMLGVQFVKDNLSLFKQTMPEYIADLQTAFIRYQQDSAHRSELTDCAHKIKGAAASIGLTYLQQIAEQAQRAELSGWKENITEWVELLTTQWLSETEKLERWLASKS